MVVTRRFVLNFWLWLSWYFNVHQRGSDVSVPSRNTSCIGPGNFDEIGSICPYMPIDEELDASTALLIVHPNIAVDSRCVLCRHERNRLENLESTKQRAIRRASDRCDARISCNRTLDEGCTTCAFHMEQKKLSRGFQNGLHVWNQTELSISSQELRERVVGVVLPERWKKIRQDHLQGEVIYWDYEFAGDVLVALAIINSKGETMVDFIVDYGKTLGQLIEEIDCTFASTQYKMRKGVLMKHYNNKNIDKYLEAGEAVRLLASINLPSYTTIEYSASWCDFYHVSDFMVEYGTNIGMEIEKVMPDQSKVASLFHLFHQRLLADVKGKGLENIFAALLPESAYARSHRIALVNKKKLLKNG